MTFFKTDKNKCKQDGFCVSVCPIQILEMKDGYPNMKKMAHLICLNCGHCVSVCPEAAIDIKNMPADSCLNLDGFSLNIDDTEKFLRQRRSIRKYKREKVDKQAIEKIIDIARYAPSGHNSQPLNWRVVYDTDKVKEVVNQVIEWMKLTREQNPKIAKLFQFDMLINSWEKDKKDLICRNAPHLIICHSDEKIETAPIAGYTAIAYLELAAPALNIGTCWAGYLNTAINSYPPLKETISIPESHKVYGAVMVGYPKFNYKRAPLRKLKNIEWV